MGARIMRVRRSLTAFSIILFCSIASPCVGQTGTVEALGPLTDASVPETVRQAMDAKGQRVLLDDSSVACEIWLRKSIPAQAKTDAQGALYTQLAESTLIGVLHFPQASTDYRGQAIPAGYYTLRYELLPNDGNHLGAAPSRDFLLLVPAGSDPDPNATSKFQELVALSRGATKTKHPGVLSLVQPPGGGPVPAAYKRSEEHTSELQSRVDLVCRLLLVKKNE